MTHAAGKRGVRPPVRDEIYEMHCEALRPRFTPSACPAVRANVFVGALFLQMDANLGNLRGSLGGQGPGSLEVKPQARPGSGEPGNIPVTPIAARKLQKSRGIVVAAMDSNPVQATEAKGEFCADDECEDFTKVLDALDEVPSWRPHSTLTAPRVGASPLETLKGKPGGKLDAAVRSPSARSGVATPVRIAPASVTPPVEPSGPSPTPSPSPNPGPMPEPQAVNVPRKLSIACDTNAKEEEKTEKKESEGKEEEAVGMVPVRPAEVQGFLSPVRSSIRNSVHKPKPPSSSPVDVVIADSVSPVRVPQCVYL